MHIVLYSTQVKNEIYKLKCPKKSYTQSRDKMQGRGAYANRKPTAKNTYVQECKNHNLPL